MSAGPPDVAIGIPAWGGTAFIGEAIESALNQRDVRTEVVVSIDEARPDMVRACQTYSEDSRVRLIAQPTRLGPALNYGAALSAAAASGAEFICLLPDDDLLDTSYLAELRVVADRQPSSAVVFSGLQSFGLNEGALFQPSVTGSPLSRQVVLLLDHFNAVAFRGLTRTSAFHAVAPLTGNAFDDYAVDTLWMARLALVGDLIGIPKALYRKRYREGSEHARWQSWGRERKLKAWAVHCADMLKQALTIADSRAARSMLRAAAEIRLLGQGARTSSFGHKARSASDEEKAAMLDVLQAVSDPA